MVDDVLVHLATDLDAAAIMRIARCGDTVDLTEALLRRIDEQRARMLEVLSTSGAVYGITTAMGALSEQPLDTEMQASHQGRLLLARAVGGPPWLSEDETRAALAVRLRTLLDESTGVSAGLCRRIAELLTDGPLPSVPRTSMGAAGEIIALAHLAAPVTAGGALVLGPKEGVALIEGVPVTTALAILRTADVRYLLGRAQLVLAAQFALTGASRDCLHPATARADEVLADTVAELRRQSGTAPRPRALQPPVSFRVSAQVHAHLVRAIDALDAAVSRALDGVTDSPAFVDGQFVGTAGFSGYDLAAHLHSLTVAVVGATEIGAARLHRLLDPRVTGLGAQLSPQPGLHTGLAAVHKRAAGAVHAARRTTAPTTIGTIETSGGQEDVQSFSLEAADALRDAVAAWTEVLACELLAVHQMRGLGAAVPPDSGVDGLLDELAARLPADFGDRPWGPDIELLRSWLAAGTGIAQVAVEQP